MTDGTVSPNPRWQAWLSVAGKLLALVFVFWIFQERATGWQIREPLTWDECLNLENYTWTAFEPDGSPRRITRADELLHQPRPSGMQLAAGLYRSVGVWREPNDHVPHSVMLNAAMLWPPSDERVSRLPALLGALVFAVAIGGYCRRTGSPLVWPVALILAAAWPYAHFYSLQARGYSWMLAFQVSHLIALRAVTLQPASIWRGAVSALLGIITFMNILSLALDWLLPVYSVLWLFPPVEREGWSLEEWKARRTALRRNLVVQFLVIVLAGLIFLADHLPYVILAMREFGVRTPLRELPVQLQGIGRYLFPTAGWQIVTLLGVIGWFAMLADRSTRFLGLIALAVVGVSLLHFIGTKKVPYTRTCAYILPMLVIGVAHLADRLLRLLPGSPGVIARTLLIAGVGVFAFFQLEGPRQHASVLTPYRRDVQGTIVPGKPYVFLEREPYIRMRHLPPQYRTATDDDATLASVDGLILLGGPALIRGTPAESWDRLPAGDLQMSHHPARNSLLLADSVPQAYPAVVIWMPQADKLGLRNEPLYEAVGDAGSLMQRHYRPVFNKLEFNNQVYSAEFLVTNPEDFLMVRAAVLRGLATAGGTARLIEPTP